MSNRIAWLAVAVVVIVVGLLVFRSLRSGAPATVASSNTEGAAAQDPSTHKPSFADSLAKSSGLKRLSGVQEAQVVLKSRGFYNGPIDGSYTVELRDGIMAFQKANGMKVDGYLNDKLYIALGIPIRGSRGR